jgi:hypothetical protein
LERVKWTLWHGRPDEALAKLYRLMTNVADAKKRSKLEGLYDYLERNKAYLVHAHIGFQGRGFEDGVY